MLASNYVSFGHHCYERYVIYDAMSIDISASKKNICELLKETLNNKVQF